MNKLVLPKVLGLSATLALALLANPVLAQSTASADKPKPLSSSDKKFIKDASESLYYQLRILEVAKRNAATEAAKQAGEKFNGEAQKMWEELAQIAEAKGEKMPIELSGSDKGAAERLGKAKEEKFDKQFYKDLSKEAKKLATTFETASKSAQDPEVKAYAEKWHVAARSLHTDVEPAEKEAGKRK
jgi:hypothetical protein